ncbi:hypothetical protein V6N13_112449 [Hibiscus sabdariffa]
MNSMPFSHPSKSKFFINGRPIVLDNLTATTFSAFCHFQKIKERLKKGETMNKIKISLSSGSSTSSAAEAMGESKKKVSCRRLGGYLRQQKGRLYIIRRCAVMLLCWHD